MADCNEVFADHIQRAASEVYPGDLVTRWVALVETMAPDGERALIVTAQPGSRAWDTLGLLQYAMQLEQAAAVNPDE